MFDPRKSRQRRSTLDTIKASIDGAKRALLDGDIDGHDEAMGMVVSFLDAYERFPRLIHIGAEAETPATSTPVEDQVLDAEPAPAEPAAEGKPAKK